MILSGQDLIQARTRPVVHSPTSLNPQQIIDSKPADTNRLWRVMVQVDNEEAFAQYVEFFSNLAFVIKSYQLFVFHVAPLYRTNTEFIIQNGHGALYAPVTTQFVDKEQEQYYIDKQFSTDSVILERSTTAHPFSSVYEPVSSSEELLAKIHGAVTHSRC